MQFCFKCNIFAFTMIPQLFILGFLHILQPGHGQILLFSTLSLQNLNFSKILKLSIIFGLLHSILLFIIVTFAKNLFLSYHDWIHDSEIIFAIIIMLLGLFIITKFFLVNPDDCNHSIKNNQFVLYPILLASMIPCPTNMTFLLTNFLNHDHSSILFALFAYSFGISLSLFFLTSLIFIYGQNFIKSLLKKNAKFTYLISGLLILFMGIYLFIELIFFHN